jgi:hypothetical protein
MSNQTDDEEHQEHNKQDFRDAGCGKRDKSKPECTSNQCNHEENQCVVEHAAPFWWDLSPAAYH